MKFMSKEVARSMCRFRRSFWNWLTRLERGEAARGLLRASWILAWSGAVGLGKRRQMGGSLRGRPDGAPAR